jgi:hypothetical protein
MEKVISVKGVNIRVKAAKDKRGRKGYFVAEKDLPANAVIKETVSVGKATVVKKKTTPSLRPEVVELLSELNDYKDGKIKTRSFDEFIESL